MSHCLKLTYRYGVWCPCWVLTEFFWSTLYERRICDTVMISTFGWSGTTRCFVGGSLNAGGLYTKIIFLFGRIKAVSCVT